MWWLFGYIRGRLCEKSCCYLPENESTKVLLAQAVNSLNAIYDALQILR